MKSLFWSSTHPAWDTDGLLHCTCGHTSDDQKSHLEHVLTHKDRELAATLLPAKQFYKHFPKLKEK